MARGCMTGADADMVQREDQLERTGSDIAVDVSPHRRHCDIDH